MVVTIVSLGVIVYLYFSDCSKFFTACSTVLVPARVVQALNLNLEDMMGAQPQVQPRFSATLTADGGVYIVSPLRSCFLFYYRGIGSW